MGAKERKSCSAKYFGAYSFKFPPFKKGGFHLRLGKQCSNNHIARSISRALQLDYPVLTICLNLLLQFRPERSAGAKCQNNTDNKQYA